MSFIAKYYDRLLWIVLLIVLIIGIRQCKSAQDKSAALAKSARELQQKVHHDSLTRAQERKRFNDERREVSAEKELAVIEKAEADKKVQAQQRTIDRLSAVVRAGNGRQPDTSDMVLVTPGYKDACDSLPAQIDILNLALADRDTAINSMLDLYDYEIQIRDEEIYKEMNYSDSLHKAFNMQAALLKSAISQGRPRGRLLGGLGILGNQKQFLSGFSGIIAYQSKGGKQYQVSPKFLKHPAASGAELFWEGSVLITIFK